jgi:hypothetical protein
VKLGAQFRLTLDIGYQSKKIYMQVFNSELAATLRSVLRRNIRWVVGCAIVLVAGIAVGLVLGSRGHARHSRTTEVVTVATTVTVAPGGGSSSP